MKPAQHELAKRVLTAVNRHILFENCVKTTKEVVFPMLLRILRYELSRAGNLGLTSEDMELPDKEELWRLVHSSAFDDVTYSKIIHCIVITSPSIVSTSWGISKPTSVPEYRNITASEPLKVLLWLC